MIQFTRLFSAVGIGAHAPPRPITSQALAARGRSRVWARALLHWLSQHREALWLAVLLLLAATAHGLNMFHYPYFEDDEGTYMSQAWAVLHLGQLAPYTYWYDHAPAGWLQIAIWSALTGGVNAFGPSVESGRVFMLVLQVASTALVYGIGRRISGSVLVATVASLLFVLSAYGGYFHRRVLLDNLTTPWMLLSIFVLLSPRLSLEKVWLSAAALGVSIMSKELTIFLAPVLAYLVFYRAARSQRAFAVVGWLAILGSIISLYVLMAVLKGELFPTGSLFGGKAQHVSLLGTLQYQASRGKDGGPLNPHSAFWQVAGAWVNEEPLLVVGGTACALIAVLLLRWRRLEGVIGLCTFSLWAFIGRGGEIIEFYLVPLLPLLALSIALLLGMGFDALAAWSGRRSPVKRWVARGVRGVATAVCLAGITGGYFSTDKGFAGNHLVLWTSTQADAQNQAMAWIVAHVPVNDSIITDNYLYTDLHDGHYGGHVYRHADYYWKLDQDPAIKDKVYHDNWRNVDYVIETIQMQTDARQAGLALTSDLLRHSVVVAHFDTGGWPVQILQVVKPGLPAPRDALPEARVFSFAGGENDARRHAFVQLSNPAVTLAAVSLTFYFANGATDTQTVDVDPSSRRVVPVAGIERRSGPFGLVIHADVPISAHLVIQRDGSGGDSLIVDKGLATAWSLTESESGIQEWETLALLNPDQKAARVSLRMQPFGGASVSRNLLVAPHASATLPLDQAGAVEVHSDTPIAVERTVRFSAVGYTAFAKDEPAGWLSSAATLDGRTRTFLTLYSPRCAAILDGASVDAGDNLAADGCRDATALATFLRASGLTPVPPTSGRRVQAPRTSSRRIQVPPTGGRQPQAANDDSPGR